MRWAIQWRSYNRLDGKREYFISNGCNYFLFRTKREADAHIKKNYAYIAKRKDLRAEPHVWRVPKAIKVEVILNEVKRSKG